MLFIQVLKQFAVLWNSELFLLLLHRNSWQPSVPDWEECCWTKSGKCYNFGAALSILCTLSNSAHRIL